MGIEHVSQSIPAGSPLPHPDSLCKSVNEPLQHLAEFCCPGARIRGRGAVAPNLLGASEIDVTNRGAREVPTSLMPATLIPGPWFWARLAASLRAPAELRYTRPGTLGGAGEGIAGGLSMAASVNVYTWPQLALDAGATVTFVHSVVDGNGISIIDPDRWYWMSAVPDWGYNRPDRPVSAATVEIVSQWAHRDRQSSAGANNTTWFATWRNPESTTVLFRPKLLEAPAP